MMKLPKELELPRMKDHQLFDRARIVQLQDLLQDKFKALKVCYTTLNVWGGNGCGVRPSVE